MASGSTIAPRSKATGKAVRAKELPPPHEPAPSPTPDSEPTPWRFTVDEYRAMADADLLTDGRTELIDGIIFNMAPQKSHHATSVSLLNAYLHAQSVGTVYHVRSQVPGRLADDSMLEPDTMLVRGAIRDYRDAHPSHEDFALVIEVSDSTLRFDRTKKLALYARAGIADYWIVNVADFCVEVYREPHSDTYRSKQTFDVEDATPFAPLALPDAEIRAADLLP